MATAGYQRTRRKRRHGATSDESGDFIQTRSGRQLSRRSEDQALSNISRRGKKYAIVASTRTVLKGALRLSKGSESEDGIVKETFVGEADSTAIDRQPEQNRYLVERDTGDMEVEERIASDVDSTSNLPETFYSADEKAFEQAGAADSREVLGTKTRSRTRSKSSMLDRLLPTPGFVDKTQLDTQGGALARRRPPRMASLNAAAKVNLFFEPSSPLAGKSLTEIFQHAHNPRRSSRKHSTTSDDESRSSESGSTESNGHLKEDVTHTSVEGSGVNIHIEAEGPSPSTDKEISNGLLCTKDGESSKHLQKHDAESNMKRRAEPDSSTEVVDFVKRPRLGYRDMGSSAYLESLMKNGDQREEDGNVDSSDMEGDMECDTTTDTPTMVDVSIQVDLPRLPSAFSATGKHRVRVLNVPVRAQLQTNTTTLNFTKNHVVGPLPPLRPSRDQLMSKTANTKRTASLNAQAMVNAMLGGEGPLSKLKNAGNLFAKHAKVRVLGLGSSKENIQGSKEVLTPVPALRIPKINFAATSTSTFSAGGRRPVGNPVKNIHLKNLNVQLEKLVNERRPREPKRTNGWMYCGDPLDKPYCYDDTIVIRRYYSSIQRGDEVINVRDAVLLKAGTRRKDLPFVARVSGLWEEDEGPNAGEMMMSVFWYYRPEQTEVGRIPDFHGEMEVMASRHKDDNSVACIVDKCYTLSYPEYCRASVQNLDEIVLELSHYGIMLTPPTLYRFRAQAKLYLESRKASSAPVPPGESTKPGSIPPPNTDPSLVFFCRQVYDYRMGRIMKNPGV